jgi:hypothetical protein
MKNYNFPDLFPVDRLTDFDFGNVDGFIDERLYDTFCFTNSAKFSQNNNKSLIIGPPGSGKSALYKAYEDSFIMPKDSGESRFLVIGISEDLQYLDIDRIVKEKFGIYKYPIEDKYILLWDTYFLFKVVLKLKDDYGIHLTKELRKFVSLFGSLELSYNSNFRQFLSKLYDITLKIKWKFGGFLFSGDAKAKNGFLGNDTHKIIDLAGIKKTIDKILEREEICIWIMIDRIDEFVLEKEFEIQKRIITSLIKCEGRYSQHPRMFLKLFIRDDLLERVDPFIGQSDKIDDKIINLKWTPVEIRRFMAKRLLHNYINILGCDISSIIDDELLVDHSIDEWEAKEIYFKDKISKKMLLRVFPRKCYHFTVNNNRRQLEICKYFDSHFMLSKKSFSPRIMLRFLQIAFEKSQEYYLDNPGEDKKVQLNENQEYPLVKKQLLNETYRIIVDKTINWTLNKAGKYSIEWRDILVTYFNSLNKNTSFSLATFCEEFDCTVEDARVIMAFLENVGAIKCYKPNRRNIGKSKFSIPLFFRSYAYHGEWQSS